MGLKVLHNITYGLYVVSSKSGDKVNGCILNSVMQTSAEPQTVSICINRNNLTYDYIKESGVFSVSILPQDVTMKFIGRFGFHSGRDLDKFAGVEYKLGEETGVPVLLENSMGYIEARVKDTMDVETHTIIAGDVVNGLSFDVNKEPLTYAYYHKVKKGKSPKAAPSYQKEDKTEEKSINKYRCEVCGYIYNPQEGDPDNGVKPGTEFKDLPEDWLCPVCGVGKDRFTKI